MLIKRQRSGLHIAPRRSSTRRARTTAVVSAAGALVALFIVGPAVHATSAPALTLCNNDGNPPPVQHVIVVMLENESQKNVVGDTAEAPYINNTLTKQCSYASSMFGATHFSAANYLALTAGQFPPEAPKGCGSVSACDTPADNLFHQMETNGLSWKLYYESMPNPCTRSNDGMYSLGHNPAVFYTDLTDCAKYDVPVADLDDKAGPLWDDLQNRTLPAFSFITPNNIDNGHDDGTGVPSIDGFLSRFLPVVQESNTYQDGNTAILVTFDEGAGGVAGQNCTNQSLDMAGNQESCHIPFFVVYPYADPGPVDGFFTHYSVTRTVEELFGLPLLANAQTANSLIDPFGLGVDSGAASPTPTPTATSSPSASPPSSPSAAPSVSPSLSPSPTLTPTPSPTATSPPPGDYVTNGGFETGTENGWSGVFTGKSVTTPTQAQAQSGSWSLAITSTATDVTSSVGVTSKPPIIASTTVGTSLTGSVWVKGSAGMRVEEIVWETAPDGTTVDYGTMSIRLPDSNWHLLKMSSPYVTEASGDSVWFSLFTKNLPAGGALYADNFSLT